MKYHIKALAKFLVLSGAIAGLAACSSTGGNSAPIDNADGGSLNASKVSGVGDQQGFGNNDSKFGSAEGAGKGSTMTVGEQTYYFDFNKNDVHEADKPSMKVQADYLIKNTNSKLLLEGHTDPRGSREYNIALGERRANAVAEVLKADGASSEQIRTVSFGAEKLASQGHTDADYALDRRVHLLYVDK